MPFWCQENELIRQLKEMLAQLGKVKSRFIKYVPRKPMHNSLSSGIQHRFNVMTVCP